MKVSDFGRAVVAGFFAAYVMSVVSTWTKTLGVPADEATRFTVTSLGEGGPTVFSYYMNGIVLALIYARWVNGLFNLHPLILANLYGFALVFIVMGILVPILAPEMGFFAFRTGQALGLTLGTIIDRVTYATVLSMFYLPEGEG